MSQPYDIRNYRKTIINPGSGQPGDLQRSDISRILPRQLSTGSTRGTQTAGYGNAKVDGANNRITVGTPDGGSIGFGAIPTTTPPEYGFFALAPSGKLSMKIVGGTFYAYDPDTGLNTAQFGILPNGQGGVAGSNEGFSVEDGF